MTTPTISTPEQAHGVHTEFVEYRKTHRQQDANVHAGYWGSVVADARDDKERAQLRGLTNAYHIASRTLDDVVITRADSVFLTDDLRELVKTAEATMPDDVLFRTDLFTPCGFVVLETPLAYTVRARVVAQDFERIASDLLGAGLPFSFSGTRRNSAPDADGAYTATETYTVRALMWGDAHAVGHDTEVLINDALSSDATARAYFGKLPVPDEGGVFVRVYGNLTSMEVDGLTASFGTEMPLSLVSRHFIPYGASASGGHGELDESLAYSARDAHASSVANNEFVCRFTVALLRLMEDYVDAERTRVTRAHGRRAERSGRIGDVRDVVVLSLRRALYDDDGSVATGRKVTLAHLVRGHWRNQWYPSQQTHRAKWIRPHRRGGAPTDEVTERPRILVVDR